jgi:hypothetical protein
MKWIVMVPALVLAACATEWKKPGASPQDLSTDTQACTQQAQGQLPARMITLGGYMTPNRRVCEPKSAGAEPVCSVVPGEMVPPTLVDQNQRARDTAIFNCMRAQGWTR